LFVPDRLDPVSFKPPDRVVDMAVSSDIIVMALRNNTVLRYGALIKLLLLLLLLLVAPLPLLLLLLKYHCYYYSCSFCCYY
jgi:hypothetical protein